VTTITCSLVLHWRSSGWYQFVKHAHRLGDSGGFIPLPWKPRRTI
jgi:hypothetical protein